MRVYSLGQALSNKESVTQLHLHAHGLEKIPAEIFSLQNLQELSLSSNRIKFISPEIAQLQGLRILRLEDNLIEALPAELTELPNLKTLDISQNKLKSIPEAVFELTTLEELKCNQNKIEILSPKTGRITGLKNLELYDNRIKKIPKEIGGLKQLERFVVDENQIGFLPVAMRKFENLRMLSLSKNRLKKLPDFFRHWPNLNELDISHNKIRELSEKIGLSTNLHLLNASFNKLTKLPATLGRLKMLRTLKLKKNNLELIPESIGDCKQIRTLDLSQNSIGRLPDFFKNLPLLTTLDISANQLLSLPQFPQSLSTLIATDNNLTNFKNGELNQLVYLDLSKNKLPRLPDEFQSFRALKTLILNKNEVTTFNENFFYLDNLEVLKCDLNSFEIKKLLKLLKTIRYRSIPDNLRLFFYKYFSGKTTTWDDLSLEDLFVIMDCGVDAIYRAARKHLFNTFSADYQKYPVSEGSRIFFVGNTFFDIKRTRAFVEKNGAFCDKVINEKTTHIVLGRPPYIYNKKFEKGLTFIGEKELTTFLNKDEKKWMANATNKNELENLRKLLLHSDETNVFLAVQMIKEGGVPQALLTDLLIAYKNAASPKLKRALKTQLNLNCSDEAKAALRLPFPLKKGMGKPLLSDIIKRFTENNEFDEEKMKAYYLE